MLHVLSQLGTTVLGEIVKKMITGGMAWAANRKEPEPDIVELKLGQIAEKNLPDTIPDNHRQAVVTSLVDLVMPTFEQVVEFNPNIQRIKTGIRGSVVKKSAMSKSASRSRAKERSTSGSHKRGESGRSHSTKKEGSRSHSVKKSASRSHSAKTFKGR